MDPENKPKGPSPNYSLYQRDIFKRGGETGIRTSSHLAEDECHMLTSVAVPSFSVHPEELQESTKKKLNDRGYYYANSNAGLGWTDRANRPVTTDTSCPHCADCPAGRRSTDGASCLAPA